MTTSPRTLSDIGRFLRTAPLFADLSEPALAALAQACRPRSVPKGCLLFNQCDPAEAAYVVRSGSIAIVLMACDGRQLVINEMRAGDCFGELALLTKRPRSTGAVARERSDVIVIPRDAFLAVLEAEPRVMRRILEAEALRLTSSSERESALAFLDAQARLARCLLRLARQASADGFVTISQEELAQRIGLTRQTVAKTLSQWRKAGWLITGRGKIVVLNRAALRQRAEEVESPTE